MEVLISGKQLIFNRSGAHHQPNVIEVCRLTSNVLRLEKGQPAKSLPNPIILQSFDRCSIL